MKRDLLKPRYKVIADYPGNTEEVGFIYKGCNWCSDWYKEMASYPRVFRKLEWWEERSENEMPDYIRIIDEGMIVKVNYIDPGVGFEFYYDNSKDYGRRVFSNNTTPATQKEFEEHQSTQS